MSSYRSFRQSSRKEQPAPPTKAAVVVGDAARKILEERGEELVNHLVVVFLTENRVDAMRVLMHFANGGQIVENTEPKPRRSWLVAKWAAELEQVDKENAEKAAREKAEKEAQEAAAALEASSRELGQLPDPEAEARTRAFTDAFVNAVKEAATNGIAHPQPAGQNSNTFANEIGLPAHGQPQIPGAPSIRRTLPNGWDNHEQTTGSTEQVFLIPVP